MVLYESHEHNINLNHALIGGRVNLFFTTPRSPHFDPIDLWFSQLGLRAVADVLKMNFGSLNDTQVFQDFGVIIFGERDLTMK